MQHPESGGGRQTEARPSGELTEEGVSVGARGQDIEGGGC